MRHGHRTLQQENAISSPFSLEIDRLTAPEWADLLPGFDDASVYQTWSYGAVHWGGRQLHHVLLKKHGRVVSMAQVRVVRVPRLRTGIAYIRWGPLFRLRGEPFDAGIVEEMTRGLKREFVERQGLLLRALPHAYLPDSFTGEITSAWAAHRMWENSRLPRYRTIRLGLTESLEGLRKQLDQKWRNCLNSAERNQLTVLQGTGSDYYDKFLQVYSEMFGRKNFNSTVDVYEFGRMQADLPGPLKMQVLLCEKDGQVLNAVVVSAIGDTAIYLLGATSAAGLKLKGAYLLQWQAVQWAKSRGCRWYELGGINPETNPGVYHFKSGLGGEHVEQAGVYDLSGSWRSRALINAAGQFQAARRRLQSWFKPRPTTGRSGPQS